MTVFEVLLGDVVVGHIGPSSDGRIVFRFTEAYRRTPNAMRPVLGQFFEDDLDRTYRGRAPGELPAFFAHLLPEGKLRGLLERSLALDTPTDLELLAAVGDDLPGAVRIRPSDVASNELGAARGREGDEEEPPPDSATGFRFSLAGVQLKFSVIARDERFTVPARDSLGDWIVKVSLSEYEGLAENEYAIMSWARAAGFDVPEARLVSREQLGELQKFTVDGRPAFAIRRYDRQDGSRIHQEDMAQVFGRRRQHDGSEKYASTHEELGAVLGGVLGRESLAEFIRRVVFVVATGNSDAHLKNWSLIYPDGVTPRASPLYDQVATIAWPKLERKLALKFASTREFGRISADSIGLFARRIEFDTALALRLTRETLERLRDTWASGAAAALPAKHAEALRDHWTRVPILRDAGMLA